MATIKRRIFFHQVNCKNTSFSDIVSELSGLDGEDMYSTYKDEDKKAFLGDYANNRGQVSGVIRTFRGTGFPSVSTLGERDIRPLDLADDDGLIESSHFVYFPERSILGIEYNHYGPRAGTIVWHARNKITQEEGAPKKSISFRSLIERDVLKQLDKFGEVRLMHILVPKISLADISEVDQNLFDSLTAAANVSEADAFELVLRPLPHGKKPIFSARVANELFDRIKSLGQEKLHGAFHKFDIKAVNTETHSVEQFDLLQNKLVSEASVIKTDRGRGVQAEDMFEKIKSAYVTKKDALFAVAGEV